MESESGSDKDESLSWAPERVHEHRRPIAAWKDLGDGDDRGYRSGTAARTAGATNQLFLEWLSVVAKGKCFASR
jgi:hypothetical protein